jgi:hypothetical protein
MPHILGKSRDALLHNISRGRAHGRVQQQHLCPPEGPKLCCCTSKFSGPLKVTDHNAHYILQEASQLSPRVDIISSVAEEDRVCSERPRSLEREDRKVPQLPDDVEDPVGLTNLYRICSKRLLHTRLRCELMGNQELVSDEIST